MPIPQADGETALTEVAILSQGLCFGELALLKD